MRIVKSLIFSSVLVQLPMAYGEGLPKHRYQQEVKFAAIAHGDRVSVTGKITLPFQQAGKNMPPSGITLYEKKGSEWIKSAEFPFTDYDSKYKQYIFNEEITLKDPKQPFVLHFTAVHCHETGRGLCVIDNFQGTVGRDSKQTNRKIEFALNASDPNTYN